jgi:ABC-2 type transport system permease protein
MKDLFFLLRREFRLFWSNKILATTFLLITLFLAIVLGSAYKQGYVKQVSVIVVDKDFSPLSARFCDMLEDDPTLHVIRILHETIDLHQTLLDTRATAIVVIPDRFEAQILSKKHPEINCYLNMANTLTAGAAGTAISVCAGTLNAGIAITGLEKQGVPPALATRTYEALKLNIFRQYNPAGNYVLFLWPGLIFAIFHQLILLVTAVSFSQEFSGNYFNKDGLLKYSRSPISLLIIKMTPTFLMSLFILAFYFLLSRFFHVPPALHPGVLFLSEILLILSTCFLGMLYSIIYPDPAKASQLLMSIAAPAFTLTGFTWPADQIPVVLKTISQAIPLVPFDRILRKVLLQQASISDVLPGINHQLVLIGVYMSISIMLLTMKIRKESKKEIVTRPARV